MTGKTAKLREFILHYLDKFEHSGGGGQFPNLPEFELYAQDYLEFAEQELVAYSEDLQQNKIAPQKPKGRPSAKLYKIGDINPDLLVATDTLSFNQMLDYLGKIPPLSTITSQEHKEIIRGLKIAKVFRNKEGHVATLWHDFDPTNYSDIERALVLFYRIGFEEHLEIQFSVERNEPALFKVSPLSQSQASG